MSKVPQPLTDTDDIEAIMEHEPERLAHIDGKIYDVEDLFTCADCGEHSIENNLDEDDLCETCAQDARDDRDHYASLRSEYNSTRF